MARLGRILIYTKRMEQVIAFYSSHFGYTVAANPEDRIVELVPSGGQGAALLLHPAGKSQKEGQALIKLVFDVEDVPGFCRKAQANGLEFGPVHQAGGYVFANAKDPSGNSVQVSGRAFSPQNG